MNSLMFNQLTVYAPPPPQSSLICDISKLLMDLMNPNKRTMTPITLQRGFLLLRGQSNQMNRV